MSGKIVYQNLKTGKYYTYKEESLYKFRKTLYALQHDEKVKVWDWQEPEEER